MANPRIIKGGLGKAKQMLFGEARLSELLSHGGDKALPLMLPRANLSSDFINQQAERVARQMAGEHVVSGKPKETFNLAGRSKKESQRVKGLNYKLSPTGTVAQEVPYTPRRGDLKVAIPGDQTVSNKILDEVNGFPIDSVQEGGAYYGLGQRHLADPEFWKSNEEPAKRMQSKVDRVAELYEPDRVIGSHLAMGPMSNNFAMHLADANLRAVDWSKAQPNKINIFDSIIAYGYKDPKTGEMVKFPNWPGLADREGALTAMKEDANLRKWFNDRMKTPKVTKPLGLPNGLDIQYAITEPRLRDMEINMTGLMTGELQPGALVEAAGAPHNTYSHRILGKAGGPQEVLTPFVIDFPDAAQHIASTKKPADFTGTIQKVFPHQLVDDQYLNQYGEYRDRIKELTGQKEGGAVDMEAADARLAQAIQARMAKGGAVDMEAADARLQAAIQARMGGKKVAHMAGGGKLKALGDIAKKFLAEPATAQKIIQAPSIIIPSKISNVKEAVRQSKGEYGAKRVERAADEIPNLERLYKEEALKQAFQGDNAKALMTMNPADFEKFSHPLAPRKKPWPGSGPKKENLPTSEYVKYLSELDEFHDIPFLEINKQEQGLPLMPFIAGHEGRHRNRALTERGESAGLVQLFPRSELREPFPRRSQDEYLQALRKELEMTGNLVLPEKYTVPSDSVFDKQIQRPAIELPDIYAKGGGVHMAGAGGVFKALGDIGKKFLADAPQAEALKLAQQRAALPPAKGGLGLPADNTPQQRAAAMKRNTDAYHGSKQDITGAFRPGYDDNLAFVTKSPEFANKWIGKGKMQKRVGDQAKQELKSAEDMYRDIKSKHMDYEDLSNLKGDEFHNEYDRRNAIVKAEAEREFGLQGSPDKIHSTVYPLTVESNKIFNPETDMDVMAEFFAKNNTPQEIINHFEQGNYLVYETKPVVNFLKSKGYDSMRLRESSGDDYPTIAVFNPESIRGRFAAHDPFRRDAATAAAMGVLAPDLMAEEKKKADGGKIVKGGLNIAKRFLSDDQVASQAIGKAAESAGMKAPVTANKPLTNLQDVYTSLGDRVNQGAVEMQNLIESMPYKYDKGQRVFTADSVKKNKPPYTILRRVPYGNQPMREDHPNFQPGNKIGKPIIDPATGKTQRTPYEPGYHVRYDGDDGWTEFQIPESAIKGDVEMARGGLLHMADAGRVGRGLAKFSKRLLQDAPPPALKIKPPSDNVANVRQANFQYPKTIGNQTVAIDKLSGGVRMSDPKEVKRVKALADQMSGPEGYISRIVVDHNDNVIEGQHRLEALRQLGVKDVPVFKIEDLADTMPVSKMEQAMREVGGIHSDHVNQLMQHALDDISEGGIEGARGLDYGQFQKHYDAALDAVLGMRPVLPAAESDANLAKMLESSAVKNKLYHGTGRDIQKFDKSKLRRTAFGEGFHLAESPNLANFYANQFDEGQNVMPVYAAIKNPYELKSMHDWYDIPGANDTEKTNLLKSQGYDGIRYPHGAGDDKTSPSPNVYVAFEPEQIKSAIGNRGTYDTSNPDISKAEGGPTFKKLQFMNDGGIASPEENITSDQKPNRFSRVASEMYDEYKQSLANDYERLKASAIARAQLAKIAAAQLAGGSLDFASMVTPLVNSDALLSAFPMARAAKIGLTGSPSTGRRTSVLSDEKTPYSLADYTNDINGNPKGGSEDIIKRAQKAGLMYGGTRMMYDAQEPDPSKEMLTMTPKEYEKWLNSEGRNRIDFGEQITTGRFSPVTEIGTAILGGNLGSKLARGAVNTGQKFKKGFDKGHARAMSRQAPPFLRELEYTPSKKRGGLTQLKAR